MTARINRSFKIVNNFLICPGDIQVKVIHQCLVTYERMLFKYVCVFGIVLLILVLLLFEMDRYGK